jgi:NTP pyrophosphatase (non-canonical NTP hydrolase)
MMSESVIQSLQRLVIAADERYGAFASTHEAMGVALEEWDELREAIKSNDFTRIAAECLDLAAVCIRLHDQLGTVQMLRERSVK